MNATNPQTLPLVWIVMGSTSDAKKMEPAEIMLKEFGVEYLVNALSAHRTPHRLRQHARGAEEKGIRVIIAGAGGAAHLAGAIAAETILPVIGVPISGPLGGLDALLSTVQMPPGVPVATVAIDGAKNAAILAVQILAADNRSAFRQRLRAQRAEMEEEVKSKDQEISRLGIAGYLAAHPPTPKA